MLTPVPDAVPTWAAAARRPPLLPMQRFAPALSLHELLRAAPVLHGDIGHGMAGVPLELRLELCTPDGGPVPRALVCIWHPDPQGWSLDFGGDELDTVSCMRGAQIGDEMGRLRFRTVYPGAYRDGRVLLYLQVYLHDGQWVRAWTDLGLQLPTEIKGPVRDIPLAQPLPARTPPPRFPPRRPASQLQLPRLEIDPGLGGLLGHVRLVLAV